MGNRQLSQYLIEGLGYGVNTPLKAVGFSYDSGGGNSFSCFNRDPDCDPLLMGDVEDLFLFVCCPSVSFVCCFGCNGWNNMDH